MSKYKKFRYTHAIDRVMFYNRWKYNKYVGLHTDSSDYTIIGIGTRSFSPTEYEYIIAFFGFDLRIWIKKTPKQTLK